MEFDINRWPSTKSIQTAQTNGHLVPLHSTIYNCPTSKLVSTLVETVIVPLCLESGLGLVPSKEGEIKSPGVDYNSTLVAPWASRKIMVQLESKKEK